MSHQPLSDLVSGARSLGQLKPAELESVSTPRLREVFVDALAAKMISDTKSIDQLVDEYLSTKTLTRRSASTMQATATAFFAFCLSINLDPLDLPSSSVSGFISSLSGRYAPLTIINFVTQLTGLYSWLSTTYGIYSPFGKPLVAPSRLLAKSPDIPTAEHIQIMLDNAQPRNRLLIDLIATCGLTLGELNEVTIHNGRILRPILSGPHLPKRDYDLQDHVPLMPLAKISTPTLSSAFLRFSSRLKDSGSIPVGYSLLDLRRFYALQAYLSNPDPQVLLNRLRFPAMTSLRRFYATLGVSLEG